jgi:glycogen(starch) synthase
MNLLLYSHAFAPSIGGIETQVMALARGLAENIRVVVVTKVAAGQFEDQALPFQVKRRPRLIELFQLIRTADVVHVAGPALAPMILALLLRKPVIIEHHGYQACCLNGLLLEQPDMTPCGGAFLQRDFLRCARCEKTRNDLGAAIKNLLLTGIRRWLCQRTSANIAVSHHLAKRLRLRNSSVVYHGVPDPGEGGATPATETINFGYIGRLVAEKGLPILISAASRLKREGCQFRLRLVGDGPERPYLEQLCAESGLDGVVTFTGFAEGPRLEAVTSDVNVTVVPSICEETAGLSAIEQMVRARPVIAADIGGLAEVVDGAGVMFAAGDAEALGDKMRDVIQHPDCVARLGAKARDRALTMFGHDRMVAQHLQLYEQILTAGNQLSKGSGC